MVNPSGSEDFDFRFRAGAETDPNFKQLPEQLRVINDQLKNLERQRSLKQLAADAAKVAEETGSTRQATIRLRAELAKFGDITLDETRKVVAEFDRLTQAIERSKQAGKDPIRVKTADDRFNEVSQGVGLFGDFQSNLGALSALTGIREIGVVGEIVALGEELPRLKAAAQGLPEQFRNVVSEIGGPGLGLIGGLAVLAVALKVIEERAAKAREAAGVEIQGQLDLIEQRETLTTEQLQTEIKQAEQLRDIREAQAAEAQRIFEETRDSITPLGALFIGLGGQLANEFKAPLDASKTAAENAGLALRKANTELENLQSLQGQLLRNDIAAFEEELDAQRQKSSATLAQLADQEQAIRDAFSETTRQREEDARLNRRFLEEDRALEREQRETRHQEALALIEQAGQDRIEDLRAASLKRIGELEAKRNETLAQIATDLNKRTSELQEDHRADELKRAEDFRVKEDKIARDRQRELLRRAQDNAQELLDAELANDVSAFLAAKQRQQTEAQREQEDFAQEKADRQREFEEERQARRQQLQERIADLHSEADERTRVALEQFAREKAAQEQKTQEAIVKELAAIDQRTNAAIEAYNREVQAREDAQQRADDRQAIRDGITESRRLAAHNEQLRQIEERRAAENGLLTDIINKLNAARLALAAATNQPVLPVNPNNTSSTPGGLRAFAEGTNSTRSIYGNKPGIGILNDLPLGWDEAIIPYRQGTNPISSKTINVNVASIAPGVTPSDLKRVKDTIITAVMMADHAATTGVAP